MELQHFETKEIETRRNEVSSGLSSANGELESSQQWSFIPGSAAPAWPQPYLGFPVPVGPETLPTFPSHEFWSDNDAKFGDSTLWDRWEASGEYENSLMASLDVDDRSDAWATNVVPITSSSIKAVDSNGPHFHQVIPADGVIEETSRNSVPLVQGSRSPLGSLGVSNRLAGSMNYVETAISSFPTRHQTSKYDERIKFEGDADPAVRVQAASTIPSIAGPAHKQSEKEIRINIFNISVQSYYPKAVPQTTEKKYRSKLNDEYATLFKALPDAYLGAGVGGKPDSSMTKVETLQLAIDRISLLEEQQNQLTHESVWYCEDRWGCSRVC
ncbi:hypothetical protein V8E51_004076 [Hyaloscypha variabilis]